jgi:hypothetical protein
VDFSVAKDAWAVAARPVLERTARTYHATVSYGDLAKQVQVDSGIRTKTLMHYWIGGVLGRIAGHCYRGGEPLLSALCVDASGSVGPGYGVALAETYGGPLPEDLDIHAANERLRSYRHFGAELPPGGGVPALTPKLAAARRRARQRSTDAPDRAFCPTCHLMLPRTGQCDNCA